MVTLPLAVAKVPAVVVIAAPSLSTAPVSTLPLVATSSLVLTVGLVTVRSLTKATLTVTVPVAVSSAGGAGGVEEGRGAVGGGEGPRRGRDRSALGVHGPGEHVAAGGHVLVGVDRRAGDGQVVDEGHVDGDRARGGVIGGRGGEAEAVTAVEA